MKNKRILYAVLAAMFTALTAICTVFVRIPFGVGGYVHLGDTIIYLAASVLPLPYALAAAAIGGAMSDIISGYAVWAPFSLVIKALLALTFSPRLSRIVCRRNIAACALCVPLTVGGYFVAERIIYGSWATAVVSMPWNLLQAAASAALFAIIGAALDKISLKSKLMK